MMANYFQDLFLHYVLKKKSSSIHTSLADQYQLANTSVRLY